MRKIYLFVALVMAMFVLTPAKAAVKSATDLFGKWSFKANIEFTDNSYKDKIFGESDVVIKADPSGTFVAEIDGLCGVEDSYQVVSKLEEVDGMQTLRVVNPNGGGWDAWGSLGLWMADIEGNNPFGMDSYGPLNYVINDAGTEITMADFSFVKISDFNAEKGEIIANDPINGVTQKLNASVGDGKTDDRAAIVKTHAAANEQGASVKAAASMPLCAPGPERTRAWISGFGLRSSPQV